MPPDDPRHYPKEEWGTFTVDPLLMQERRYKSEADALGDRDYQERVQIPALSQKGWSLEEPRAATLRALYSEVCAGWRTLTDVRFKLLGFLPAISVAAVITLVERGENGPRLPAITQMLIAAIGLVVSIALWLYEKRNTMLYNDLVGRGRRIEAELGIHTGLFRGRPKSTRFLKHDIAIHAIYVASLVAWSVALLSPLAGALRRSGGNGRAAVVCTWRSELEAAEIRCNEQSSSASFEAPTALPPAGVPAALTPPSTIRDADTGGGSQAKN